MTPRKIGRYESDDPTDWQLPMLPPGVGRSRSRVGHRLADSGGQSWADRTRGLVAAVRDSSVVAAVRNSSAGASVGATVRETVGPGSPPWRRIVVALSLLVPLLLVGVACGKRAVSPTTAQVTRASVATKVTSTGALRAISEQNLGFEKGGKLVELNVSVGEQVTAGQVLARVDDFGARAGARKAQAALAREQAALDELQDSEKVAGAADDAKSAQDVLDAMQTQSDQTDRSNDRAVERARERVREARAALRQAQVANRADDVRCRKSFGGDSRRKPGEVHQPGGLAAELNIPAPVESAACDRARKSESAVGEAAENVSRAQSEEQSARDKRNTDHAEQDVAIQNAKRSHRAAKHDAKDAKKTRSHEIEAQEAAVEDALTDVDVANRDIENTVLRAPVDGRVGAINGTVGEYLSGGSGTTPLSPGSRVSLPDVTSDAGASSSSDTKAERPGLGSFMVLDDVHSFQVVVPFEESDAAKVAPNQTVDVSFDSLPDLTVHGTVVSVSPTGTSIQDVTNYYVSIVLNQQDSRLKDGLTAQANVVVGQVSNALVVPSTAVQQGGQTGLVTVLNPDGSQRQVQVQLGLAGDGQTQVISGLREGETVVLPEG